MAKIIVSTNSGEVVDEIIVDEIPWGMGVLSTWNDFEDALIVALSKEEESWRQILEEEKEDG